jgi:hypothetical protein
MTDINSRDLGSRRDLKSDALDLELNAALEKLAAVEPRAGLEQRVLANLRAEQPRAARGLWWQWPAFAALAAVAIVLTASAMWRAHEQAKNVVPHRSLAIPRVPEPERRAANPSVSDPVTPRQEGLGKRKMLRVVSHSETIAASAPKLDRFPSPRPLTEQEKILQSYFSNYPKDAVLVARALAEAQRRDAQEEMSDDAGTSEED